MVVVIPIYLSLCLHNVHTLTGNVKSSVSFPHNLQLVSSVLNLFLPFKGRQFVLALYNIIEWRVGVANVIGR